MVFVSVTASELEEWVTRFTPDSWMCWMEGVAEGAPAA